MEDIQEQLAALRRRIARVDRKYATRPRRHVLRSVPTAQFIQELMSGEVVTTALGEHFETEKVWERHRRHGSVDISDLAELAGRPARTAFRPVPFGSAHPTKWAFLDTETTGLAGGTGTYAFLIGVGSIDSTGFRLRQFFMRDYGEEASQLHRLAEYLEQFDVLITYNGKAYDQPLLETRFRMARARHPFDRMEHLDLLFGARRLWKLRLESCRLVDLENRILGVERQGDLPGEMIPYVYFDYLRTQQRLPTGADLPPQRHRYPVAGVPDGDCALRIPRRRKRRWICGMGPTLIGLARWLLQADRHEEALRLFRRAVEMGLPDHLLFQARCGKRRRSKRRLGRDDAALAVITELAGVAQSVSACGRSKSLPSITSIASGITRWRSR